MNAVNNEKGRKGEREHTSLQCNNNECLFYTPSQGRVDNGFEVKLKAVQ